MRPSDPPADPAGPPRASLSLPWRLLCFALFGGLPGMLGILIYSDVVPGYRSSRCVATFCEVHWTLLTASCTCLCFGLVFLVPPRHPGVVRALALGALAALLATVAGTVFGR